MRRQFIKASVALAVSAAATQAFAQVNGKIDTGEYQFTLATQTCATGFGVNFSQMDAAYATVLPDGSLKLMITGNQENNGNGLTLMIDNGRGGSIASIGSNGEGILGDIPGRYTQALGTNPNSNINDLKPGSRLAPGFNPRIGIGLNLFADQYYTDVYWLAKHAGDPDSDNYVGNNAHSTGSSAVATYDKNGINGTFEHAYDNRNTVGGIADPLSSQSGYEVTFSAAFLNVKPGSTVKVLAYIAGGNSRYLSNQFLPGLPVGTGNLGGYDGGSPGPEFDWNLYPSVTFMPIARPTSAGGSHNWSSGAAWSTNNASSTYFPTGINAQAVINGSKTVTLDTAVTLGTLEVAPTGSVVISGSQTLTFQTYGDNALVKTSGAVVVDVPVALNSGLDVQVASGTTTFSQPISAPTQPVTKSGSGTLALNSLSAASLTVDGGTVTLPSAPPPTVSVLGSLSVANDGAALGIRAYTGKIDIGRSAMVVRGLDEADGLAKLASVADMARAAQTNNGGDLFGGNGLTSSLAAADASSLLRYAVGVVPNSFGGSAIFDTFNGVAVTQNDVLVKFTYFGDADLSGSVDDTDFFLANNGYLNGLSGWVNGDFDYSGVVDDTDFFLLNNGYLNQGPGLRAGGSVPEPTGMGLIALAAGGLLGRRRK